VSRIVVRITYLKSTLTVTNIVLFTIFTTHETVEWALKLEFYSHPAVPFFDLPVPIILQGFVPTCPNFNLRSHLRLKIDEKAHLLLLPSLHLSILDSSKPKYI
jgi:hypothetical protein